MTQQKDQPEPPGLPWGTITLGVVIAASLLGAVTVSRDGLTTTGTQLQLAADVVQALATLALVLITGVYVLHTRRSVQLSEQDLRARRDDSDRLRYLAAIEFEKVGQDITRVLRHLPEDPPESRIAWSKLPMFSEEQVDRLLPLARLMRQGTTLSFVDSWVPVLRELISLQRKGIAGFIASDDPGFREQAIEALALAEEVAISIGPLSTEAFSDEVRRLGIPDSAAHED